MADKPPQPSDLELQVLTILWQTGPLTARQVLEKLPDGKQRAYTTVLTVMQVMEKKGLLTHERDGTRHIYAPTVTRKQVVRPMVKNWVSRLFGGSPAAAVQHLLNEGDVSSEEVAKIRQFLSEFDEKQKSPKQGKTR